MMNITETVFDWVVASSLQASLPVVVVLVIQFLLRKQLTARWRYALWLPVLLTLLLPKMEVSLGGYGSMLQPDIREWAEVILVSPNQSQIGMDFRDLAGSPTESMETPSTPFYHGFGFPAIWLVGSGLLSALALSSLALTLRRVARSSVPAAPETILRIERISEQIGLHRLPRVWVSPAVKSPAVCGLWRGLLMLNESFEHGLSRSEQEMVLRHELTHLRRKDLMWNALSCLLLVIHWFNPLVWLAFYRACADREAACDADVLGGFSKGRRQAYGHTLLKLETGTPSTFLNLGFIGIQAKAVALRRRLRLIISEPAVPAFLKPVLVVTMLALVSWGLIKPAMGVLEASELTLAGDAFGRVSEAYLKDLFDTEARDGMFVKDRLSRADYNSKQKHRLELHESRRGMGMAYFRTNGGNYGKLLYTWGIGAKLHLKEIVVFDSRSGETIVRRGDDIVLQAAGHYDLDTGLGTHPTSTQKKVAGDYRPDLHCSSVHGEDRHLTAVDGASFLFPIEAKPNNTADPRERLETAIPEAIRHLDDTRTRCIVIFRECLVLFDKKDLAGIFQNVADTAGPRYFIFSDPGSESSDVTPEIEDVDRFFKKSRAEKLAYRIFDQLQFSDLVTDEEPITVTNKKTGKAHKAKSHTIKIKMSLNEAALQRIANHPIEGLKMEEVEALIDQPKILDLRFVQIADKIYWIPFKW